MIKKPAASLNDILFLFTNNLMVLGHESSDGSPISIYASFTVD
jgi:hypothetical protein